MPVNLSGAVCLSLNKTELIQEDKNADYRRSIWFDKG